MDPSVLSVPVIPALPPSVPPVQAPVPVVEHSIPAVEPSVEALEPSVPAVAPSVLPGEPSVSTPLIKDDPDSSLSSLSSLDDFEDSLFTLEGVANSVLNLLSSEQLQLRLLGDWVVFTRQEWDFNLKQEPFQVVAVLLHLQSGRYLVRVWHRTLWKGEARAVQDLESVLWDAFHGTVPCLGVDQKLLEETFETRELPLEGRMAAKKCDLLVRREELSPEEQRLAVKTSTCFRCKSLLPEGVAEEEEKFRMALLSSNVEVGLEEFNAKEEFSEATPKRRKAIDGAELKSNSQCKYCLEEFPSNQTRYVHERDVHLSGRFNCQVCGRYCSHVPELLEHFRGSHSDKAETELRCPICEEAEGWPDYIKHYKSCLEGKKSAVAKGEYKRKKKGKEEIKCHYCAKTFRKKCDLTNHYRSHNGEKLTCPECDFQSHSIHTIYTHRRSHARARGEEKSSHFCDLCGQNFTTRNYLQKHVRYAHEQVSDDIKCEFCGEVFERQHTYNRHKNKEHSDDPKFACAECGARFGSESEVKKHSWSHSSQPRLFCDLCGKGLKTQKSMKAHMLAHKGEKPYKCNQCDYCCVSSSALSLHKRFKHRGGEPMAISKANGRA